MSKKRSHSKKTRDHGRARRKFFDKLEIMSIVFFIFALFLLDVNLNMISAYGVDVTSPFTSEVNIAATSLFWFGFIVMSICLLLISIRYLYRKVTLRGFDVFFSILGIISWGIILSGGLLIFNGGDAFFIPFFSYKLARIDYYHIGIGLSVITMIYFALTK